MRLRRRTTALTGVATGALIASVLTGGIAAAPAVALSPDATAVFSATPQLDGVAKVRPGDASKDPAAVAATVDGVECWQMQNDPYVRYVYVDVADEVIPDDAARAIVTVDYFDAGTSGFDIHYDAKSGPWTGSTNQQLTDTQTWKTATFELTDINFANRSNGSDFRLNVKAGQGSMPPVCFSKVEVTFTDQPVAALDSLAIMSPSLIFKEGESSVQVATPADEVSWRLGDENDVELRTGTAAVADGEGAVDLTDLPFGYYTLDVTAEVNGVPVTRTTSLAVLDDPPPAWNAENAFLGTQMHRGWQAPVYADALMDAMVLSGYGLSRIETTWGEVEKAAGEYTFDGKGVETVTGLAGRGQQVMWNAGLDNPLYDDGRTPASPEAIQAFAAYAAATAEHYSSAGLSHDVGILNEYNSSGFNDGTCGLTAACYLDILRPTYDAVHAVDPDANVIAPITAGVQLAWAQDFIAQGGLDKVDTYATNYYGYQENGPGTPPEQAADLANLAQLAQLIDDADGDRQIPLRVTENGWPTHTAGSTQEQQADYAIRGPVLAQLAGADEYLWYDLYDDGFDGGERENRFGLINRADDTACWLWVCPGGEYEYGAVHGISPKPGFVSQAVLIRKTAGLEIGAREDLGSESAYAVPYSGDGRSTRVLWSTGTDTVTVTSVSGFTLTDQFGGAQEIPAGDFTLQLTGSPVFVEGEVTVASAAPSFTVEVPETSVQQKQLPVTVRVADGVKRTGEKITVSADGVEKTIKLKEGEAQLTLPAIDQLGEREITVSVADKHGAPLAQVRGATRVIDPYTVSARPVIETADGGYAYGLDITVVNNDAGDALTVDTIDWALGARRGTVADPTAVEAGGSATVRVDIAEPALFGTETYAVTARAGVGDRADSGPLSFSPIEPEGAASLAPIDLNALGQWKPIRSGTRTGPEDLGGSLQYTATGDALVMHATITDDVHLADRADPALSWQADSVQFNTYDLFPTVLGGERVEIAASLGPDGPAVYTFTPPAGQDAGLTPGAVADIVRDDAAGTTTYTVSVPWASLGYDGPPAGVWGLSFLVNDADGDVPGTDSRAGYLEWGAGVGAAPKNPALFKSVQIVGLG